MAGGWRMVRLACMVVRACALPAMGVCVLAIFVAALNTAILLMVKGVAAPTAGDIIASVCAGLPQRDPTQMVDFLRRMPAPPFGWLVMVLLPFCCVSASLRLVRRRGRFALLSGGRRALWGGLCTAIIVQVVLYWAAVLAVAYCAATLLGGEASLSVREALPYKLGVARDVIAPGPYDVGQFAAVVVATSLSYALLQLVLSELLGERLSFLAVALLVSASVYAYTPLLTANFMMALRSAPLVLLCAVGGPDGGVYLPGFDPSAGICIAFACMACAVCMGLFVSRRIDIT